ncbi:molybdenum ABC transporter substrate-binding protein [Rubrobacter xylanophilus]|uniref:Molybdate-binding protein ModA n=1 Tax=Rubrobacter xylanophilus TaxID=49319 RepID=A0A510HJ04_9ACTN|nr:molybdate ABC transporter substrate-binding protein [Rubrobacter xylanophilus]BBL79961.1 molybdenum ABC transporter substrate-binding protein [Rubrobacter xylanophilus]
MAPRKVNHRFTGHAVKLLAVLALLPVLAAGCGNGAEAGSEEAGGEINVFAAASLVDAFGQMKEAFEEENPGAEVRLNFAGSSTLLTQIQQGAPADVFASADEEKMNQALEKGLVEAPRDFATNELTVIVPEGNPAGIQSLEDLAGEDVTLVLAEEEVPVAEYAEKVLHRAESEYGKDFSERVLQNVRSREVDVRAAANRVSLNEADATFVYESDITPDMERRVKAIEIPPELNVTATYPIAVTTDARNPELARRWVGFVLSKEGQRILKRWGFEPAG